MIEAAEQVPDHPRAERLMPQRTGIGSLSASQVTLDEPLMTLSGLRRLGEPSQSSSGTGIGSAR
jgi:hypothetical protein